MKIKLQVLLIALLALLALAACGAETKEKNQEPDKTVNNSTDQSSNASESDMREITYLGEKYTVPTKADRIVIAGAMESMEDAMALGVEPVGAITVAGEFPEVYKKAMGNAASIGEKQQPNFEKILELKPDVILGTVKFPDEVKTKLEQIAPTIFVSHISSDWEDNLNLLAELSGKEAQAEKLLSEYKQNVETVKATLTKDYADKTVVTMRVRGGKMFVYNQEFFFNPVLYTELGLQVPEAIQQAKAQEEISVEQLAKMNPDMIFMQVQETGNQENEQAYEELKKNPIIQNINAFKEDRVYVNIVPSLLEGGPLFSRNEFIKALKDLK